MTKLKKPFVPVERQETLRRLIEALLEGEIMSAREISSEVGIREKEVYDHLEHIHKSFHHGGTHLIVTPAECEGCGFVFKKRGKLKKPGKCPVCSSESITAPLFRVEVGKVAGD